ncbi:hypothetical protein KEM55_003980 [Ascosphaera atra]|nr:hypothetical protein KEM55_003980 [Ascosphaera atra]
MRRHAHRRPRMRLELPRLPPVPLIHDHMARRRRHHRLIPRREHRVQDRTVLDRQRRDVLLRQGVDGGAALGLVCTDERDVAAGVGADGAAGAEDAVRGAGGLEVRDGVGGGPAFGDWALPACFREAEEVGVSKKNN